jgi:hypothetical protein
MSERGVRGVAIGALPYSALFSWGGVFLFFLRFKSTDSLTHPNAVTSPYLADDEGVNFRLR